MLISRRDPARTGQISELMYADDTLILAVNNEDAQIYMQCIEQAGRMYGLQLNWNKFEVLPVQCEARIKKKTMDIMWFRKSRCFIWEVSCVTIAVLGLSWIDAWALQGRNLKHCAVSGTTLFSLRQRRPQFLKFAYFEIVVLFAHSMAQQSRIEKAQYFSSKMFQKNPQHPALFCEQDLKQAKRPPRNFKHPDLSPVSAFWKDCSSTFHWCEEAVRVFWSNPSAPDCATAAAPRTPKDFRGVQSVQTCNRCGRGCWRWWGLVFQLEAVENLGAILLFRTAPMERRCAMPMRHWREALK